MLSRRPFIIHFGIPVLFMAMTVFAGDIRTLISDETMCRFEFTPSGVKWDTLAAEDGDFQRLSFENADYSAGPGEPMLPARSVVVALPPDARVQVSASAAGYEEFHEVRYMPSPGLVKENDFWSETHERGPAYSRAGWTPSSLIEASDPSMAGDMRVAHIRIMPLQVDPVTGDARLYSRIIVTVNFTGGMQRAGLRPHALKPGLGQIVLNADAAGNWGLSPERLKKTSRVFAGGPWFKIPVTEENIYRITGKMLQDEGVDLSRLDSGTLKLYNNGGRMLAHGLSEPRVQTLTELPVLVDDGGDGHFDTNDALFFYGKGVTGWQYDRVTGLYSHYIHFYDDVNIYWLTFGGSPGKRIAQKTGPDASSAVPVSFTGDWFFYEKEETNPIEAGIQWFSQEYSQAVSEQTISFTLNNPVAPDTLGITVQVKGGQAAYSHNFDFQLNDLMLPGFYASGASIRSRRSLLPVSSLGESNRFTIHYQGSHDDATGFLDWFEIAYKRPLSAKSDRLLFSSPDNGNVYAFQLSGFSGMPLVWDVTDPASAASLSVSQNGGVWQCVDAAAPQTPRRYAAFRTSAAVTVSEITEDTHVSNLRDAANAADMIIIAPDVFSEQAERLKAMRETADTLRVMVVDIQDVYDEFSWGLKDMTAIRDFMVATRGWQTAPGYLLLFGDGNYVYKPTEDNSPNWIPTYEIDSSDETAASAVDDWFARIQGNDTDPDIAIGRLPVQTEEEAKTVVDKIVEYETANNFGIWRATVTLVADDVRKGTDQNHTGEMTHTEAIQAISVYHIPPHINQRKIFLTEYEEVIQADGRRKPEAKADLFEQIHLGTMLVNYIGHGNEGVWAHEQVLSMPGDLPLFHNAGLYPLMYGATCTFARFDLDNRQSLAEWLLLLENAGSITSIGATRECFANENESLNKKFLDLVLNSMPMIRVGEALRLAKVASTNSISNDQKYTLLGDPALRLALPHQRITLTHMEPDSFKALSLVGVDAAIDPEDPAFQGKGVLTAFDSDQDRHFTFYDKNGRLYALDYTVPGNTLFRGETSVKGGGIDASFIV
ncbi:type IX secretion system sortase PorU, partial [bacterium]|nr:type IX secretion system sortase PorU [bacterium]